MVDGVLYDERQIVDMFNPGRTDTIDLDPRQETAIKWSVESVQKVGFGTSAATSGLFLAALSAAHPGVDPIGVDSYNDNIRIAKLVHPELGDRFAEQSVYDLDFASESLTALRSWRLSSTSTDLWTRSASSTGYCGKAAI